MSRQASAEVDRLGRGLQTARATGSRGNGSSGSRTRSTSLAVRRRRPPTSARATDRARTRVGREDQAHRVLLATPIDRGWISRARRLKLSDRRTDLEHVGAKDPSARRAPRVGVVLHEGGTAGLALGDHLQRAQHHGGLPVALAAETVTIGHQALDGEAGELAKATEILEVGGERTEPARLEERAQSELDPRSVAQRLVPSTTWRSSGATS